MTIPTRFEVIKTTTDKLENVLNDCQWDSRDLNPDLVQIEHVGGRDWVIIIRAGSARASDISLGVVKVVDADGFKEVLAKRERDRRDGWLR